MLIIDQATYDQALKTFKRKLAAARRRKHTPHPYSGPIQMEKELPAMQSYPVERDIPEGREPIK